jgi:hypothetical protein
MNAALQGLFFGLSAVCSKAHLYPRRPIGSQVQAQSAAAVRLVKAVRGKKTHAYTACAFSLKAQACVQNSALAVHRLATARRQAQAVAVMPADVTPWVAAGLLSFWLSVRR